MSLRKASLRDAATREWMMLWTVMGRPSKLSPTRMRGASMEAFQYVDRLECCLDGNTTLSVLKLYRAAGCHAHNFLVTLRVRHPERKRRKNEEHQHQYPEDRVPQAIVEALDHRTMSPP